MGVLEKEAKRKRRNKNIEQSVLTAVALAGALALGATPVRALSLLELVPGFKAKKRQREIIARSRDRLLQKGLLVYRDGFLCISKRGEARLRELERADFKIKKPKRWDKRWRILMFDIPESRKALRDKIRLTLTTIGFVRLQDSVWVFPYDCEDLITLLKMDFKVGKELLYLIVETLENDRALRDHFNLP